MKFLEPYLSGNSFMNDGILNLKVMKKFNWDFSFEFDDE